MITQSAFYCLFFHSCEIIYFFPQGIQGVHRYHMLSVSQCCCIPTLGWTNDPQVHQASCGLITQVAAKD